MKNQNLTCSVIFILTSLICSSAFSELVGLSDHYLSNISGQLLIDPLEDEDGLFIYDDTQVSGANSIPEPISNDFRYNPLSSIDLAEQQGQGVRFIHTIFPTGGRSPDNNIGTNGNLNFYGRDYRTGDNFDRVSDCLNPNENFCEFWDHEDVAQRDGIPGENSNGNADFMPSGNTYAYDADPDGYIDDYYYEYDWYGQWGVNGVANGAVPDSPANWHFYRMETDALIKIIATIKRMSSGGYTANTGICGNGFESTTTDGLGGSTRFVGLNNGGCNGGWSNYSSTVPGTEGEEDASAYRQNYEGHADRKLAKNDITNYFNYDSEIRNIQAGSVSCGSITNTRAEFLSGNAGYFGHCEADERQYNPLTLKNPFTEIALAPECELFAEPDCDNGGSTDLVFAGYRSGFESVSGSLRMNQYVSTGSTNATLPGEDEISCNGTGISYGSGLGSSSSVCTGYKRLLRIFSQDGVLLYGHRSRGMAALPGNLCVTGTATVLFVPISSRVCPELGTGPENLQSNIAAQDIQGLWSSVVRNDFQWPGQGWAAEDGNTASATNFRSTLADRDYGGVNTHISTGLLGHGGTVINNYSGPAALGIGAAYTHTEIGL